MNIIQLSNKKLIILMKDIFMLLMLQETPIQFDSIWTHIILECLLKHKARFVTKFKMPLLLLLFQFCNVEYFKQELLLIINSTTAECNILPLMVLELHHSKYEISVWGSKIINVLSNCPLQFMLINKCS